MAWFLTVPNAKWQEILRSCFDSILTEKRIVHTIEIFYLDLKFNLISNKQIFGSQNVCVDKKLILIKQKQEKYSLFSNLISNYRMFIHLLYFIKPLD